MKRKLLFLILMFSVALLYAQNNESDYQLPIFDKDIFNKSELIFEGSFVKCVATYATEGYINFDNTYGIYEYQVGKVYKGDQSLVGNTILIVKRGEMLGSENIQFDHHTQILFPHPMEEISFDIFTPSLHFLTTSDYPDDENSKYFKEKKYVILDKVMFGRHYAAPSKDYPFSNRTELHHWMKQFDGYAFPDWEPREWKPGPNWINGADQDASVLESEYYKNQQIFFDSINNETMNEIEEEVKKKEEENSEQSRVNKTLTLYIHNPVKVQEGSKWYLKFDVMVKSNAPETYLAETAFTIKYNTSIFGALPLNKITYTFGEHFNFLGNNYTTVLFLGSDYLSFNFGDNPFFPNPTAPKAQLTAAPLPLLHIKIELLGNVTIPASPVFFSVSELSNVSKYTLLLPMASIS